MTVSVFYFVFVSFNFFHFMTVFSVFGSISMEDCQGIVPILLLFSV